MAFPNEPERTNPEKLVEVQQAILGAIEIGAQIMPLLDQLDEAIKPLPSKYVPSEKLIPGADIRQKWFCEIKSDMFSLRRSVEQAFEGLAEDSVNTTYLGNMAVSHALNQERAITPDQEW